jgi:hypothetical protein
VEEGSVGLSAGRNPEFAAAAFNGADGGSGCGRRAREELALWRLLYSGSVPPCCAEWRREGRPRALLEGRAGSTDGQTDREGTDGPSGARPATRREEGGTSRWPRDGAWLRGTGPRVVQPP